MTEKSWPDSQEFWREKVVIVTGGAGFLGSYIVEKLQVRGAKGIIVPLIEKCDLRHLPDIQRLLTEARSRLKTQDSSLFTSQPTSAASAPIVPARRSSSMTTS